MRTALLALVLFTLSGSGSGGMHVLIGVVPESSFTVTLDGEEIPISPAISSPEGILSFTIAAAGGTVTVALAGGSGPAAICSEVPR